MNLKQKLANNLFHSMKDFIELKDMGAVPELSDCMFNDFWDSLDAVFSDLKYVRKVLNYENAKET